MRSEKEKEYRRNYKKTHPEQHRKHSKSYRKKHKTKIDEYNRLNPELRIRVTLETLKALEEKFGDDISGGVRRLIAYELLKDVHREAGALLDEKTLETYNEAL